MSTAETETSVEWKTLVRRATIIKRLSLPKILKPILDYITDSFETFCVIYTLVG